MNSETAQTNMANEVRYRKWKNLEFLLREHAAWLNQEKQVIWRRFAASVVGVSIYFAGTLNVYDKAAPSKPAFLLAILGALMSVAWLIQTACGWHLLNRRLDIVFQIQSDLDSDVTKTWPLAFRPKNEQKHDWIFILALIVVVLFILSFGILMGMTATPLI